MPSDLKWGQSQGVENGPVQIPPEVKDIENVRREHPREKG